MLIECHFVLTNFNPRSRMGSDCLQLLYLVQHKYFNPRSRMGSDHRDKPYMGLLTYFNPRSRMGSDARQISQENSSNYFNPRSRMGSDEEGLHGFATNIISIHAPAWGATYSTCFLPVSISISIHAPAWGATSIRGTLNEREGVFQSTLPHGERQQKHEISSLFL